MNNNINDKYERGKYFRKFQVWPLSNQLNYEGWLGNFTLDEDRKIAEKILDAFIYYSKDMVDKMLATSVGRAGVILQEHYSDWQHKDFKNRCIYSFIPGENPNPSDSGHTFIRKIRDIAGIPENRLIDFKDLSDYLKSYQSESIPVILVDDIVGSGAQCDFAWNEQIGSSSRNTLKDISINYRHKFIYAPLIINKIGFERIQNNCPGLLLSPAHIIGEEYCLFSKECICWRNDEHLYNQGTKMIMRISKEIGISDNNEVLSAKGFNGQGLTMAFEHGAPDAIPAFFYWQENNWVPLIKKTYTR